MLLSSSTESQRDKNKMIKYTILLASILIIAGCASNVLETLSGEKQVEYKNEAKRLFDNAYRNIPKKREYSNGAVTNKYFVPPHHDDITYPDWYYLTKSFSFKETSLNEIMAILQSDHNVLGKIESASVKDKKFPFVFSGKIGNALEKMSVLTGLAFSVDGDLVTWSEFETDFFRVSVPSSIHSFRIGERDRDNEQQQQQSFGGFGATQMPLQLVQNDSYVETTTGDNEQLDAWSSMEKNLKTMIGDVSEAFVSFDRSSSVMMVKAYPHVVKQIKSYVRALEEATMTQVVFDFQFLEHRNTDGAKGSLNLELIKNNINVGSASTSLSLNTPFATSLLSDFNPVSLGANVLSGDWSGSEAIIEALNRSGTTTILDRPTLISAHNKAAKLVRGQDEAVATSSGGGINQAGAVNNISTSVLSLGTEITVVPTIMDRSDRVFVQLDIRQSDLVSKDVFESGDSRVQTPRTNKYNSVINFSAQSGETILIASNVSNKSEYLSEDAGPLSWLLGGSRASNEEQSETLILVTPRIIRPSYR
ncbi:hypothetical protein EYR97_19630 [Alteromonas sp. KUL42]|nr:hypothetical protein EYR97_19630 [Alteromonas sp. KUL42]